MSLAARAAIQETELQVGDVMARRAVAEPAPIALDSLSLSRGEIDGYFLKGNQNLRLMSFLMALDRVDSWAMDFREDEVPDQIAFRQLLGTLESVMKECVSVLHELPLRMADILAHLTTSRSLYLIRFATQHNPAFLNALAVTLEQHSDADLNVAALRRRLEAFAKAHLLGEIFSGARLARILQIMRTHHA